jgi:hypothetical protein
MVKQNVQPLAERVLNYSEVAELITGPECRQRQSWPARKAA